MTAPEAAIALSAGRKPGGRLPPGSSVGIYQVVRLLAEGGMGRVYEVVDPSIDKPYVIKTLKRDMLGKPDAAERMRLEQRALAELDHPNIVRIITAGEHEGSPYLVMEKLGGATLRHVLGLTRATLTTAEAEEVPGPDLADAGDQVPPQRPIRWEVACLLAIELLEALAVAHEHSLGIVHRDVKPENVFILELKGRPHVKLVDFGIASLSNSAKQTVGMFRGTPRYAAPEQLRGERVTYATDLYAVGLVLFEMIVGRDPFWGERQLAIGRAHLEKSPPAVTSLAPPPSSSISNPSTEIPHRLDALIARALSKSPTDRPTSATAFAEDLRLIVQAADPDVVREAERAFVERIRGTETIASTHDLLAGLGMGAPDSMKIAQAARPRLPDPNEHAKTEFAAPPVMTLAPKVEGQWMTPDGGLSTSPFDQVPSQSQSLAYQPPHSSGIAGWAVAGALGGALVVALVALRAGRSEAPASVEPLQTASSVIATAPSMDLAPPLVPMVPTADAPLASSMAPVTAAPPAPHTPARSARPARPAIPSHPAAAPKNADVDGVPHIASGL